MSWFCQTLSLSSDPNQINLTSSLRLSQSLMVSHHLGKTSFDFLKDLFNYLLCSQIGRLEIRPVSIRNIRYSSYYKHKIHLHPTHFSLMSNLCFSLFYTWTSSGIRTKAKKRYGDVLLVRLLFLPSRVLVRVVRTRKLFSLRAPFFWKIWGFDMSVP